MDLDATLDAADAAVTQGRGLRGTRFWRAVAQVKRDTALVERYADRIAEIDRRAFEHGVKLRVPLWFGLLVLAASTAVGVIAVMASVELAGITDGRLEGLRTWFVPIAFGAGVVGLLGGTHSLAHWIVGRVLGIRFTHVFVGGPFPPRPGVKTDYASYLRASSTARAVMHASGAVVTKLVPFALIPVAFTLDDWPWIVWGLWALAVVMIATDVFYSTKHSDWKKVRRELRSG